MNEKIPSPENSDAREQALDILRMWLNGEAREEEVREVVSWWCQEEEEKADRGEQTNIDVNIKRGELYLEAGYTLEANENFKSAAEQAMYEGNDDLFNEIQGRIQEVDLPPDDDL